MPAPSLQDAQQIFSNAGLRTQYGVILPPGARVAAYVRSTGLQSGDDSFLATNLVTTLAAGLARCRSGMGDFVVCLPGHVENVADATTFSNALVASVRIIGVGRGPSAPTFTWTATAGQWLINKNDVVIAGLRFANASVGGVASAIQIQATDFLFTSNEVELTPVGAAGTFVAFLNLVGATRATISGNLFRTSASASTWAILCSGGVSTGVAITDNEMIGAFEAAGAININNATTVLKVLRNYIENTAAASVVCITFGNFACDGMCYDNRLFTKNGGAMVSGTSVIAIGAAVLVGFGANLCSNDPRASGITLPTVDT